MSDCITNVLEYKGYNVNDIVSYEGETVKQLREDFENAIDDYLEGL